MLYMLNETLQQKLRTELKAGEQLQWVGQPDAQAIRKAAMPILLFFIPWTAFALFWTAAATGFQLPDLNRGIFFLLFPLFGLPFIGVGIWGLSMPWRMGMLAQHTVYAITTQRVITLTAAKNLQSKSFYANNLQHIERLQQSDGSGNIYFKSSQNTGKRAMKTGFYGIADVQRVEGLLLGLQHKNLG